VSAHHSFEVSWLTVVLHLTLWLLVEIPTVVVEPTSHTLTTSSLVVSSSATTVVVVVASLSLVLASAAASSAHASVILSSASATAASSLATAFSPLIAVMPLHGL